jgi:hypothetical protein
MGSGNSVKFLTLHSEQKAGDFLIFNDGSECTFKWGNLLAGIEVVVVKEDAESLSAHLIRNNMSSDTMQHFDVEKGDGYVDITIKSEVCEISDVYMKCRGICTMSLEKVIFAAIRIYARDFRRCVRWGCAQISSKHARAAYHCYVAAFQKNGFRTETLEPESSTQMDFRVDFVKIIRQPINLGPLQQQIDTCNGNRSLYF